MQESRETIKTEQKLGMPGGNLMRYFAILAAAVILSTPLLAKEAKPARKLAALKADRMPAQEVRDLGYEVDGTVPQGEEILPASQRNMLLEQAGLSGYFVGSNEADKDTFLQRCRHESASEVTNKYKNVPTAGIEKLQLSLKAQAH